MLSVVPLLGHYSKSQRRSYLSPSYLIVGTEASFTAEGAPLLRGSACGLLWSVVCAVLAAPCMAVWGKPCTASTMFSPVTAPMCSAASWLAHYLLSRAACSGVVRPAAAACLCVTLECSARPHQVLSPADDGPHMSLVERVSLAEHVCMRVGHTARRKQVGLLRTCFRGHRVHPHATACKLAMAVAAGLTPDTLGTSGGLVEVSGHRALALLQRP
jgi:hypothetical protein